MKKNILILIMLITSGYIFAQNIELPDIVTEIDGEDIKAENDSLPDFADVLEIPSGSGNIIPELPDISFENKKSENINETDKKSEKNIFSEVLLAGGYPLLFKGNCSIFGANQTNPFKILFKFDSANGYGGKALTDNFSDRKIDLLVEKKYSENNINWGISAEYNYISNGMQMHSDIMNEINQENISGTGKFEYDFNDGFSVGADLNLNLYNRYGNIIGDGNYPGWLKRDFVFTLSPEVSASWAGYGFDTEFSIGYLGAFNSSKNITGGNNNRGFFKADILWNNDFVKAFGNFAVVFGNKISYKNINDVSTLVPFRIGADFTFPVYFSDRKVGISAEGGLKSSYNSIKDLESNYRFAAFNEVPKETADWYGKIDFNIPLKSSFLANASLLYSHTAFGNGVWEPDYSDINLFNGIYKIKQKQQQIFSTDFNITYHYKFFSIKGGLHSNWLDIPALEGLQMINLNIGFQDEKSKWGANLFGEYNITKNWTLPVINLDCFFQISPTIRITASLGDIVTLFNGGRRDYAGIYADRGFTGALLLSLVL